MNEQNDIKDKILKLFFESLLISFMGIFSAYQVWESLLSDGSTSSLLLYGICLFILADVSINHKKKLFQAMKEHKDNEKNE